MSTAEATMKAEAIKKSDRTKERKRKNKAFQNCPEVKFVRFLLSTTAVLQKASNFSRYPLIFLYHALWALHFIKIVSCVSARETDQDLYGGLVFTSAFGIILWWYMNSNRLKLLRLFHSIPSNLRLSRKIAAFIFTLSLFPPITQTIAKIWTGHHYNHASRFHWCRNYWVPSNFKYIDSTVFFLDLATGYVKYSVFFVTVFLYCYFCYLALRKFNTSEVPQRKLLVPLVKEFEQVMSFPVLIVFIQISLEALKMASLTSNFPPSLMSVMGFVVCGPQMVAWFVLIVYFAERVQRECHKTIDMVFEGTEEPTDYQYREMKRSSVLTAWDLFEINGKLLLIWVSTVMTYSILISGYKDPE